jgi:hypothetical protein
MNEQINEQLGMLEKELSRLKSVTDYIDETKKNAQEVIEALKSVQKNYSTYTESIYNIYTQSVEQIKKETELLIKEGVINFETTGNKIDQTNREKLIETKRLLENYRKTVEATDNLVKTVEAVDFPARLDLIEKIGKSNRILLVISIVLGLIAIILPFVR